DNGDVLYPVAFRDDELYFGRMHIGTTADDEIGAAPQEVQETVLVESADIARIGPASLEAVARTCRALSIDAAGHARRAHADGAGFPGRKDLVVVVNRLQEHMRQHSAKAVGFRV